MSENLAPIVLFVYNRPWHTRQTLEALMKNELADESELFIYSDGPKVGASSEDIQKIEEVRKIIRKERRCKSVIIIERDQNMGLADSIITGVTEIVNRYGKVIVLEDDLITSSGFLLFLNNSLMYYNESNSVFGISGFRYPIKSINRVKYNHFFLPIISSWGWGTWKARWDLIDFSPGLLDKVSNEVNHDNFNFVNHNFFEILKKQKEDLLDSWAIYLYSSMFLAEGLFVYPKYSLVKNIGFDQSATHTKVGYSRFESDFVDYIDIKPQQPSIDQVLNREVRHIGETNLKGLYDEILKKLLSNFKTRVII